MALTECRECSTQISDTAMSCPHCGVPLRTANPQVVTVTDVDIEFASMVFLLVKWAFASIPALIIVGGVVVIGSLLFSGVISYSLFR